MSNRDTDADWVAIGEREPFFGVLANEEYLSDRIDDAATSRFFESGVGDISFVVQTIRDRIDPSFSPEVAVDFGSGVGRLSFAMRAHAPRIVGVDVSPAMRTIAQQRATQLGITGLEFTDTVPTDGVDWVNSLIVLQHIPPARGYVLIDQLVTSLRPGGVLSLQISTHRDERHLHEVFRDVGLSRFDGERLTALTARPAEGTGHMSMFDYDLGRVLAIMTSRGCGPFWLESTDHGGVHGFWIFAARHRPG